MVYLIVLHSQQKSLWFLQNRGFGGPGAQEAAPAAAESRGATVLLGAKPWSGGPGRAGSRAIGWWYGICSMYGYVELFWLFHVVSYVRLEILTFLV